MIISKRLDCEPGDQRFEVFMLLKTLLSNDNFLFWIQISKSSKSVSVESVRRFLAEDSAFLSLHEMCSHSKFFWLAFSRIWTEFGDLQIKGTPLQI